MDLFETICSLSPLLLKYGGHKYACGISVAEHNVGLFAEAFERSVEGTIIPRKRSVHIDTVAEFNELTVEAMDLIEELGPFGIGNPRPNLVFEAAGIYAADSGRARIIDHNNRTWYGFYPAKEPIKTDGYARLIASPTVRREMGERFVNLSIKEILES